MPDADRRSSLNPRRPARSSRFPLPRAPRQIILLEHAWLCYIHLIAWSDKPAGDFRHQTIRKGEDLERMDGRLGGPLLHLHFTRAALGCSRLKCWVAQRRNQSPTRAQAGAKVLPFQTIRAGHSRTSSFDAKYLQTADET